MKTPAPMEDAAAWWVHWYSEATNLYGPMAWYAPKVGALVAWSTAYAGAAMLGAAPRSITCAR